MSHMILRIGNRLTVNCRDYAEASRLYSEAREESGEGGSTFPTGTVMRAGRKVARISYNGRVWPPEPWTGGMVPIFDPHAGAA